MSKPTNSEIKRLCRAIVKEAVNEGHADLWDETWNRTFTVKIGLTIAELRCAAAVINFHPTKAQLLDADEASEWRKYITELDGVE